MRILFVQTIIVGPVCMSADESQIGGMLEWECVCVFVTVEEVYSTNGA
jgi:hypothetical protein